MCTVVFNIFSIITVFPYTQHRVSVHLHRAESARQQWGSYVTPELCVLGRKHASCHPRIWRVLLRFWKICGPRINVFTRPRHWTLSRASWTQAPPYSFTIHFNMSTSVTYSEWSLPLKFPTEILHWSITSPRRVTCLVIINILDFITPVISAISSTLSPQWYLV